VWGWVWDLAAKAKLRFESTRLERRWEKLRKMGMRIGEGVLLPASTWIDNSHCFLISIGDWCGFGEECFILAHDAQMDEFLDAARIGRVIIHESCHIGARTVILPGVEIGPRTIVGAGSVISKSLPADCVCAGSPAKVICSLQEYLAKHRERLATCPKFKFTDYDISVLTPQRRAELVAAVMSGDAYMIGGHTEELQGRGDSPRTKFTSKPPPSS
jgi:maltose O-acetyltransferase